MAVIPGQQPPSTFLNGGYMQPQLINNQIAGNSALPQIGGQQPQQIGPQMPQMQQQQPPPFHYTLGDNNMNAAAQANPAGFQQYEGIMNAVKGGQGGGGPTIGTLTQPQATSSMAGLFGR